jgi:hypothetical protein
VLLGQSGKAAGNQISMDLVKSPGSDDGGVRHGALLARLCDAVAGKGGEELATVRADLGAVASAEQVTDAVGVSAMFHMMNRVANATGTPLDPPTRRSGTVAKDAFGGSGFLSRADTPS